MLTRNNIIIGIIGTFVIAMTIYKLFFAEQKRNSDFNWYQAPNSSPSENSSLPGPLQWNDPFKKDN